MLGVDTRFSHFGSWRADVDTALDWSVKYENGEEFESTFTIIKIGYNKLSFQSHPKRKITVFICYIEEKELNELRKDMNIPRLNTTELVPACDESDNATFKFGPIGVELQNSGKYWTRSGDIKIDHEDRIFKSGRELLRRHGIIAEFREFIVTIRSSFETRISLDNVSQSNIGVKKSRTIQYRALCDYSRSAREEEPHDCIDIDTVISEKN